MEINEQNFDNLQMQTHVEMIDTFYNASAVLEKMINSIPILNFKDQNQIQSFYNSLYHFAEGVECMKQGFAAFAESHLLEIVDPVN